MHLQRYLDVSQATHVEAFQRRLVSFANDLDFGIVSAALITRRPGRATDYAVVSNTPMGFEDAQRDEGDAQRDPVVQRLRSLSVPFAYDQSLYVHEEAADLWEIQAAYGYRTGIAVALHLPNSRHFVLGVDREDDLPSDSEQLTRLFADLQLLAVHAQDAACRLLDAEAGDAEPLHLTPREKEIMKWTMEGKSAWAVAQILSCSEATVNFHVRNVLRKLKCANKHQAMLKAFSLGLL